MRNKCIYKTLKNLSGIDSMSSEVADILQKMADTFRERNAVYGDNYKILGKVVKELFPNGVQLKTEHDFLVWHLFELVMLKLTRFTTSQFSHKDSIHDLAVYAAMIESVMDDPERKS